MILFDRRKFIALEGEGSYEHCKEWVSECHGKEVVDGRCGFYFIKPEWTVDTDDLAFSLEEYKKSVENHYKWATMCDGRPIEVDGKDLEVIGTNGVRYGVALTWCVEVPKTKYQVGDKVVVRADLRIGRFYGADTFVASMSDFMGTSVTISKVLGEGMYNIEEDTGYRWTDEMFVDLADLVDIKHLVQSGDVLTIRNGNKYLTVATGNGLVLMNADGNGHMPLDGYDSDLKIDGEYECYDVMSIHRPTVYSFNGAFNRINESNLIWERTEQPAEPEVNEQLDSNEAVKELVKDLMGLLSGMVE